MVLLLFVTLVFGFIFTNKFFNLFLRVLVNRFVLLLCCLPWDIRLFPNASRRFNCGCSMFRNCCTLLHLLCDALAAVSITSFLISQTLTSMSSSKSGLSIALVTAFFNCLSFVTISQVNAVFCFITRFINPVCTAAGASSYNDCNPPIVI
eukprot:958072_1